MVNCKAIFFVIGYFYVVTESSVRQEREALHRWGYTAQNGPSTWGGICKTGNKQSPINIELGTVIVKNFPPFIFGEDYLKKYKFHASNNGHTIYCDIKSEFATPVISGGGLPDKFVFKQLHLHWESEHEFDGKRADLEMHIVHYNSKYSNFAEACTKADGVAVLAVIFNKSNETNSLIEDFFEYILEAVTLEESRSYPVPQNNILSEKSNEVDGFFALRDLLPKYVSRFFRYEGSLTTPDCAEVVQWTVFINRLPVSEKVLEAFKTLQDHDGNKLLQNYRPPQELNERNVYIQIKNYHISTPELEQILNNNSNQHQLLSTYVLYCCLVFIFKCN